MKAAISVVPIIISIFMFIITIFVIKLFIKMKQKQLLVRVASSFRGSRASLSDTMRSNRTAASAKSVSIYPRVIEYHYSDGKDAPTDKTDKKDVMEDVVNSDYSEGSVPPPIFPKHGNLFGQQSMNYYQYFVL